MSDYRHLIKIYRTVEVLGNCEKVQDTIIKRLVFRQFQNMLKRKKDFRNLKTFKRIT